MADDESDWEFGSDDVASEEDDGPTADRESGESEWRYSLSDLDEGDEQSAVGGNVFGSMDSDVEVVEPGKPSLENTLFVIFGALLALVFFLQFYLLTV